MSGLERLRKALRRGRGASRPDDGGLPDGMVAASSLAPRSREPAPGDPVAAETADPELLAQRDRLLERFVLMQAELGGLYYEMAIRHSVRDDVLRRKAAELQRVDIELAQVERVMQADEAGLGGECPACGAPHGRADVFCSQCALPLHTHVNGTAS